MTYKKIAEIVGCSTSTVSKALNGSHEISEEIAKKINDVAIEIGYFKEKSKRKLEYRINKNIVIAVLLSEIVSEDYMMLVEVIRQTAEFYGGTISIYCTNFGADTQKILTLIHTNKLADAIIILSRSFWEFDNALPMLEITTGYSEQDSITKSQPNKVVINRSEYFYTIFDHLTSLGHKKIGFASEEHTIPKEEAFKSTLVQYGLELNKNHIFRSKKRAEFAGFEIAERLLKLDDRPTAIICAYDAIALGMINALKKGGLKVPDDLSLVGMANLRYGAYSEVPLTTVSYYAHNVVRDATKLLINQITNNISVKINVTCKSELIVRESTSPPKII